MKTLFVFLACCLATLPLLSQSALPAHYHCVTSGVNNGLMHPSVSLRHLFIYNRAEIAAMTAPVTGPVAITRIFFRTNNGGMKHFVRVKLQNKADVDFDTGNMKYKCRERYSFGNSDPRAMWGNPGST